MPKSIAALPAFSLRKHPHLYEINTWAWLDELSARLGRTVKLDTVADAEWIALARLGFDVIWMMGVWQRSPESRRIALEDPANVPAFTAALPGWTASDVIASPYAVAQYVPDPRIGTWDSLDRVRKKLRSLGMGFFLDFVGNHTAFDHPWTQAHPDFYVQGTQDDYEKNPSYFYPLRTAKGPVYLALAKDPYFPPWKDVAQLNHFNPAMRAAQITDLRTIAQHCDGVRCDMAMLHLNDIFASGWGRFLGDAKRPQKEFWTEVREAVPQLTLLAEAYWGTEPRLLELGFSFSYDKELYDSVRDTRIADVHSRLNTPAEYQSHLARFLENHDEARRAVVFGNDRLPAVGTLMGTLPGMRFYHQGELEGLRNHLPITLRRAAEEPPDPLSKAFYQKILHLTSDDTFHSGEWRLLEVGPEGEGSFTNLIAYEWRSERAWKVIAVNLAGQASQGRVRLANRVSARQQYVFDDVLNEVRYLRTGDELSTVGLFVRLDPYQAHFFDVTPAATPS